MKKSIIISVFISIIAASAAAAPYAKKNYSRTCNETVKGRKITATLRIFYPAFTGRSALAAKMNRLVLARALAPAFLEKRLFPSFNALFQAYAREFRKYTKEAEDPMPWSMTRSFSVSPVRSGVVTVIENWYAFTGGAHPNSGTYYYLFTAGTGRLHLRNIILPGKMKPLTRIAERYFRRARNLNPGMSLSKAGLWFKKGFKLNENFLFTARGLKFLFNSYEIAPYAWGPSEFTIPFDALKGLLRPAFFPKKSR